MNFTTSKLGNVGSYATADKKLVTIYYIVVQESTLLVHNASETFIFTSLSLSNIMLAKRYLLKGLLYSTNGSYNSVLIQ